MAPAGLKESCSSRALESENVPAVPAGHAAGRSTINHTQEIPRIEESSEPRVARQHPIQMLRIQRSVIALFAPSGLRMLLYVTAPCNRLSHRPADTNSPDNLSSFIAGFTVSPSTFRAASTSAQLDLAPSTAALKSLSPLPAR